MIKLGDKVKDVVTGMVGIVTSRTDYLNGCIRMGVTPRAKKDGCGKYPDSIGIDIGQLELLKGGLKDCGPAKRMASPGGAPRKITPSKVAR